MTDRSEARDTLCDVANLYIRSRIILRLSISGDQFSSIHIIYCIGSSWCGFIQIFNVFKS